MYVAILNDGTYCGDAHLLDWTPIRVDEDELHSVTLSELISRRHDAIVITPEMENDWEEFYGEENEEVKRAFIVDGDLINKIIESTKNAEIGGDGDSYAANSTLICVMETIAIRVVE